MRASVPTGTVLAGFRMETLIGEGRWGRRLRGRGLAQQTSRCTGAARAGAGPRRALSPALPAGVSACGEPRRLVSSPL